jgi:hypothetical protein
VNGMFVRRTWTVRLAICVSSEDGPTRGEATQDLEYYGRPAQAKPPTAACSL